MIVRIERQDRFFVKLSVSVLRMESLSRAAKGLWAELMTHEESWDVRTAHLQETGPEGRDLIRRLLRELEAAGLAELETIPGGGSGWVIYSEVRAPENPSLGAPGNTGARKRRASGNPSPKEVSSKEEVQEKGSSAIGGDSDFGGPDKEAVITAFQLAGGSREQALAFWNYNEGLGWVRGSTRIVKWQTLVRPWINRDAAQAMGGRRKPADSRVPMSEIP